jgi:uncharacterized damage-inducible protein DinB
MDNKLEVWQRGEIPDVPPLLQPVAHALLQAGEEAHRIMEDLPDELLWERPADVAPPAFHLQHIRGVIDRLFTYARKEPLSEDQMYSLLTEGKQEKNQLTARELIEQLDKQIGQAIKELADVKEDTLNEVRGVGRKQIPTTLIGLYFHAAEHSMRHIGQLLVTVRILKAEQQNTPTLI